MDPETPLIFPELGGFDECLEKSKEQHKQLTKLQNTLFKAGVSSLVGIKDESAPDVIEKFKTYSNGIIELSKGMRQNNSLMDQHLKDFDTKLQELKKRKLEAPLERTGPDNTPKIKELEEAVKKLEKSLEEKETTIKKLESDVSEMTTKGIAFDKITRKYKELFQGHSHENTL